MRGKKKELNYRKKRKKKKEKQAEDILCRANPLALAANTKAAKRPWSPKICLMYAHRTNVRHLKNTLSQWNTTPPLAEEVSARPWAQFHI